MIQYFKYWIFLKTIQLVNYGFYEIKFKHRLKLFNNHILNTFTKNEKEVKTKIVRIRKTYIISLEERVDRRKQIEKQLIKLNGKSTFFIVKPYVYNRKSNKYFHKTSLKCLSHGAIGCAWSHFRLLERIANADNEDYYIVLEDDVIFTSEYDLLIDKIILKFPANCDIFYLGSRNNRSRDIIYSTPNEYSRSFNNRLGAYGYMLNSFGAKKLLEKLIPMKLYCGGIDTAIGILIRNGFIKSYQLDKFAVIHNDDNPSSIFNPSASKKLLHKNTNTSWPIKIN